MDSNLILLGASLLSMGYGAYSIYKANDSKSWDNSVNSPDCKMANPLTCGMVSAYNTKCNDLAMSGMVLVVIGVGLLLLWLHCKKMLKGKMLRYGAVVVFVGVIVVGLTVKELSKPKPEKKPMMSRLGSPNCLPFKGVTSSYQGYNSTEAVWIDPTNQIGLMAFADPLSIPLGTSVFLTTDPNVPGYKNRMSGSLNGNMIYLKEKQWAILCMPCQQSPDACPTYYLYW